MESRRRSEDLLPESTLLGDDSSVEPVTPRPGSATSDDNYDKLSRREKCTHIMKHFGPAFFIAVGYIDPGNWATDIEAGSRFGYSLIWVVLLSNFIALLLQGLSSRLGLATGVDLARHCHDAYKRPVRIVLWLLCELAIVATDLAEVIGTALGLYLLFGIPMLIGVFITTADVLLLLLAQKVGGKLLEIVMLLLLGLVIICFGIELFISKPDIGGVFSGLIPTIPDGALYAAVGMLGATGNYIMLSSIFVTCTPTNRSFWWSFMDTLVALNSAVFVNASIIIVSAASFWRQGVVVTEIETAFHMLERLLGPAAAVVFGLGLLASGQSSAISGTLAGQIVMEGFVDVKLQPWLRRLVTRALAIVPAALVVGIAGSAGMFRLLILSQIILSLQLPFAIVPLVRFVADPSRMHNLTTPKPLLVAAWGCAGVVLILNVSMLITSAIDWVEGGGGEIAYATISIVSIIGVGLLALLSYIAVCPINPSPGFRVLSQEDVESVGGEVAGQEMLVTPRSEIEAV